MDGPRAASRLFQGEGTEGKGEPKVYVATPNDITGFSIIGQHDISFTNRTTGLYDHRCREPRTLLPQPEGKPGSEGTFYDVTWFAALRKLKILPAVRALDGTHCLPRSEKRDCEK